MNKELFTLSLFTFVADARTGMYAGKRVTADGSVPIGRTDDCASALSNGQGEL